MLQKVTPGKGPTIPKVTAIVAAALESAYFSAAWKDARESFTARSASTLSPPPLIRQSDHSDRLR
jgi:hypothetical protein